MSDRLTIRVLGVGDPDCLVVVIPKHSSTVVMLPRQTVPLDVLRRVKAGSVLHGDMVSWPITAPLRIVNITMENRP